MTAGPLPWSARAAGVSLVLGAGFALPLWLAPIPLRTGILVRALRRR